MKEQRYQRLKKTNEESKAALLCRMEIKDKNKEIIYIDVWVLAIIIK